VCVIAASIGELAVGIGRWEREIESAGQVA